MKVFVIGLPGAGKSFFGKELAQKLGIPFVDLDDELSRSEGLSIAAIFLKKSEAYFRKAESECLAKWCASGADFVMATGGGTPCFHDNMSAIRNAGTSVFLDVPLEEISMRLRKTNLTLRPLFANLNDETLPVKLASMRAERIPYYQQASFTVKGSAEDVDALIRAMKGIQS